MIIEKQLTKKQQEALDKAKECFEYASNHPSILEYRKKAREDFGFYDGTGQWSPHILKQLKERGQDAITVNKIKNLVNYMAGMEIQTRFRVAFRSHSGKEEDDELAKAVTHLGYAIQENQDMSYKSSLKFRDALITGIGWSNIYKDVKNGEIKYDYVNPTDVLFDPDDLTPTMSDMSFVIRIRWVTLSQAQKLWSKHKDYFKGLLKERKNYESGSVSGEILQRQNDTINTYTSGDGTYGSKIMVVEVQYRDTQKSYEGFDVKGYHFETFDKDKAEELNQKGEELKESQATQIMRVVYTGDKLLEFAPLEPRLPDLPDFTYIPCIWTRRQEDGVPDGWISVMKDIQRESNYRRTKLVNNLNSFRVIMDASVVGPNRDIEDIRAELKRPDSVFIKTTNAGEFNITSNQPLAHGHFEMLSRGDQELQQVSGIYDEALGKQTNAISGVAIKNRQTNSVRNQVFAFDNLRMMKKREARMMLNLIQGGGDFFLESFILTEEEKKHVLLNVVREIDGKQIVLNDIRTLPLSIYVEEVSDFESSSQEQQAVMESLLSNPNATLILQSEILLKRLGVRDYKELAQEMKEIMQQQQQAQQPQEEQPSEEEMAAMAGGGNIPEQVPQQ